MATTSKRTRGRRSPAPAERRRDPERTRQALLDAALAEFAAKGFDGARVSDIAARAGVNKQLISYYFGGKDGLRQAVIERWIQVEAQFAPPELPLDELVVQYLRATVPQRDMVRMFVREGLAYDPAAPGRPERPEIRAEVADMRRRQEEGQIAADLDPAYLLLVFMAAAAVGITIPHEVKEMTGLEPTSPEFIERYGEQLRRLIRHLAGS